MRIVALDVGRKRTGVSIVDSSHGVPIALPTVAHRGFDDAVQQILVLLQERSPDEVVLGLPLLPSGQEGFQARFVRKFADRISSEGWKVFWIDERYTTQQGQYYDGDAAAACTLLTMHMERAVEEK